MASPYIGEIRLTSTKIIRPNYIRCDGRLLNISDYKALFAIIGNTFGGDGKTTFAVPDLRGAVPLGAGKSKASGVVYANGQRGGSETNTLTPLQMPTHNHQVTTSIQASLRVSNIAANRFDPDLNDGLAAFNTNHDQGVVGQSVNGYSTNTPNLALHAASVTLATKYEPQNLTIPPVLNNVGMGKPANNMQPYLPITYMIASYGLWPLPDNSNDDNN